MAPDFDKTVRDALTAIFKRCKKSRHQIASEMSARGCAITASIFYDCTKGHPPGGVNRFRASCLPLFAEITGDDGLTRALMPEHLQNLVRLGELCILSCGTLEQAAAELKKLQVKARKPKS